LEALVRDLNEALCRAKITTEQRHWEEAKKLAEKIVDMEPPEEEDPDHPERKPEEEEDQMQRREWLEIVRDVNDPTYWEWFRRGPNRSRRPPGLNEIEMEELKPRRRGGRK
jgi:hypothetical protein